MREQDRAHEYTRAIRVIKKKNAARTHKAERDTRTHAAVGQFGRVSRACAAAWNSDAVPSDAAGNKSAISQPLAILQHFRHFFFFCLGYTRESEERH